MTIKEQCDLKKTIKLRLILRILNSNPGFVAYRITLPII